MQERPLQLQARDTKTTACLKCTPGVKTVKVLFLWIQGSVMHFPWVLWVIGGLMLWLQPIGGQVSVRLVDA